MKGKQQVRSSSSPFIPPSPGIFGSLFGPSPKVFGRESLHSYLQEKKREAIGKKWDIILGTPATLDFPLNNGAENRHSSNNLDVSSGYENQRNLYPCQLSSSIYYGGPDLFTVPPDKNSGIGSSYKNDGQRYAGYAERGDWWLGSLYY